MPSFCRSHPAGRAARHSHLFFDAIGQAQACLRSPYFTGLADLRRRQALFAETAMATDWVVRLFHAKFDRQRDNLQSLAKIAGKPVLKEWLNAPAGQEDPLGVFAGQPLSAVKAQMLGKEGSQARAYWDALAQLVPPGWQFDGRSRRPAQDLFNAALNYLYGMLYRVVESALFAAGLDPYLGIFHADEYDRPTLAFDLIEPFRPWADRLLCQLLWDDRLDPAHFDPTPQTGKSGFLLNKKAKPIIIPAFNDWLLEKIKLADAKTSRKNHIFRAAGSLAQLLRQTEFDIQVKGY